MEVHYIVKLPSKFKLDFFESQIYDVEGVQSVIFEGAILSHPGE